jgi:hypothetical protein
VKEKFDQGWFQHRYVPSKPKSVPPARAKVAARAALTSTGHSGWAVPFVLEPPGSVLIVVLFITRVGGR